MRASATREQVLRDVADGALSQQLCADLDHAFWPDAVSLRTSGMVNWPRVLGHNQISDVCLLALAVANDGCLVTLDHRVTTSTVHGATERHLLRL